MINRCAEGDATAELLERRWFAAHNAVTAMQADCQMLRDVLEIAESAWRQARTRLAELEMLRNVLDEELAALDERDIAPLAMPKMRAASSA